MKKKGNVVMMKQSRSASDIRREILDQKDTFRCFQNRLGSRSLSHDSIFLSKTCQSARKLQRVLSQETVHGKIQALQIKLQRQKMHFGPPPLVLPIKQTEDNLQPSEVLMSKNLPHKSFTSPPLPPVYTSAPSAGVDFNTSPQLIACLDNSAARHRMSIKPRNQRASTKSRRMPHSDGSRPRSESMIILERPLTENKAEDGIAITRETTRIRSYSSQIIRPWRGHVAHPIKSPGPSSPPELLVGAEDDSHSCAVGQCKREEEPAVSNLVSTDKGTKQILKAEGIKADRFNSSGPNSDKESVKGKESLCGSKPKDVDGSAASVCSVYTSSGTEKSQPKSDEELNMVTPESRNVNPISSLLLFTEESCLQRSTNQQLSLGFPVSSDTRQRIRSFTEQFEQTEGKQEPVFLHIKTQTNLNRQDLRKNPQVMATRKDPSEIKEISTPAVLTKPEDLTKNVSAGRDRMERPANKSGDMAVETQIEFQETDEENKKLKMNKVSQERKEDRSTLELKLHTTYPSQVHDKQHNTEVGSTPRLPECTTPQAVGQNDPRVFRSPPLYNTELFSPAESPVFSSTQPQSAKRDQERRGLIRYPDLQAPTQFAGSTITMSTPIQVIETDPLQTNNAKETYTELSWMTMAKEKTRNLQQLFTSTLNDLAGLQTVTQPTASTLTQISTQCNAGSINPTAAQPSASLSETQLPSTVYAFVQTPQPIQPPLLKSSISLAQPFIDQSGSSLPTCQIESIHLNARSVQISAHSTSKPVKTGIYMPSTQIIHAAQQQLPQMPQHQAYPRQQSRSQSVTNPQSSHSLHLSHSPKLTHRQPSHQSVLQHRPLVENISSLPLEKVDWSTMSQEKTTTEVQAQYRGSMGDKASLIGQWHYQKPDTVKVDQKSTPDTQTYQYQYFDEFPTISNRSKFTELAVSPRPVRLDREVKWQKKTFSPPSPPSSSHLESSSDSRQPSWMELAKRKSMAWSDKSELD